MCFGWILMNPVWGLCFFFSRHASDISGDICWAEPLWDLIDGASLRRGWVAEAYFRGFDRLLSEGSSRHGGVVIFLPQICSYCLVLAFLEVWVTFREGGFF